jgi:hypothetical protein
VSRPRAKPPTHSTGDDFDDEHDEYEEAQLVQRRAFRERERVARRKLFTKLGMVILLAIAVAIVVPLAIAHVRNVADHNAEIKARR